MLRKPLNKIRYPFLRGPFTENPLPFKKLNRKGLELRNLSNKRGLTEKIRKIQKNIIKQEKEFAITKIKNTRRKQTTVEDCKQIHNFIKPSFLNRFFLRLTKNKTNIVEKNKVAKSKYMFSLEQLKAEFYRKQTQHNKSSPFKILLEERKKCSIAYGCLNRKQMQKIFLQAKKFEGKFDENFVKIAESRLDIALFRICFFPTLFSARQSVNHGHILVNNSVINLPGYQLKGGDIITVAPDKKSVVKRGISLFIAEKIKIRACHYLVKINIFYGVIKSCVLFQKIKPWIPSLGIPSRNYIGKEITKKGYGIHTREGIHTKMRKILLFFKKSLKKIVGKNTNKIAQKVSLLKSRDTKISRTLKGYKGYAADRIQRLPFFLLSLFFSKKKGYKGYKARNTRDTYKKRDTYKGYGIQERDTRDTKDTRDTQLFPFLKVRNFFTSARPLTQRVAAFKISGMKPLNLEVCYKNMVAIFLYSPQKVALPVSVDLHYIAKSLQ